MSAPDNSPAAIELVGTTSIAVHFTVPHEDADWRYSRSTGRPVPW